MLDRTFKFVDDKPISIGFMAVIYTHDPAGRTVIWHKSKVVTTRHDADVIVVQWGKQDMGYNSYDFKSGVMEVFSTLSNLTPSARNENTTHNDILQR